MQKNTEKWKKCIKWYLDFLVLSLCSKQLYNDETQLLYAYESLEKQETTQISNKGFRTEKIGKSKDYQGLKLTKNFGCLGKSKAESLKRTTYADRVLAHCRRLRAVLQLEQRLRIKACGR